MELPPDQKRTDVLLRDDAYELVLETTTTHHECFTFTTFDGRQIMLDVTVAKTLVSEGQTVACVPLELVDVFAIARNNEWTEDGVDKADPSKPGIAIPMRNGDQVLYILIDGTHRAVRSLRDGSTFSAYLLNDDAARRCYLKGDRSLLP